MGVGGFLGIGPSEEKLTDFRQSLKDFSHRLYQASVDTGGLNIVEAIERAGIRHKLVPLFKEQREAEKRLIAEPPRIRSANEEPGSMQRFFEQELSQCINRTRRLDELAHEFARANGTPDDEFAFLRDASRSAVRPQTATFNFELRSFSYRGSV